MAEHTAGTEVFMPLLDEGTDVWRPVRAQHVADDVYRIIGDAPDPDDEVWQFVPGTLVRCREQKLSRGVCLVAFEVARPQLRNPADATPTI